MIYIKNLFYSVGDRNLLNGLDWVIKPNKRIGLIGPNGAGKTTFFKLLTKQIESTSGEILIPKGTSIGYLPQEEIQFEPKSILDIVLEGHEEITLIEDEMHSMQSRLKEKHDIKLIEQFGKLQDRYNLLGGFQLEASAKKVLSGLGFSEESFDRSIYEFSGGWRMRVHLARLLLQKPDFLLMDEPTNHLDLHSLEWLEEYLLTFPSTIILISHDRLFLNRLANEIAELDNGRIFTYAGNYNYYEIKKKEQEEQLLKQFESQKAERERLQKFIERFRYKATKAAQVQSRVKILEKMDVIEIPEKTSKFTFNIKADIKSFNDVLTINDISFSYDKTPLFNHFDFTVVRGEKIALVGNNGEGKTTLTKLINGNLKPLDGLLKLGQNVTIGYYAQHQTDALDINKSIFEEVEITAATSFRTRLRDILGLFRFHGDDIFKPIKVLSGGEKARVSLAKILLSPCNFLIMDEPTNHLDMASKEALEIALQGYDGTLMIISHDRYFLDRLVSRVIELKGQKLYDYPGNYSYYLEKRKLLTVTEEAFNHVSSQGVPAENALRKKKEQKRLEAEARKSISKERSALLERIEAIELQLDETVKKKIEMDTMLSDPLTYNNPEKIKILKIEYSQLENLIINLENEWEEKHARLENLLESVQLTSK